MLQDLQMANSTAMIRVIIPYGKSSPNGYQMYTQDHPMLIAYALLLALPKEQK